MNFINRISADGQARERLTDLSITDLRGVSPDGKWLVAMNARGDNLASTMAIPVDGGSARILCQRLVPAGLVSGRAAILHVDGFFAGRRPLVIAPVPAGRTFPEFPAIDSPTFEQWAALPGAEALQQDHFIPSNDPAMHLFTKSDELRNLFRIPLTGR